jgi:hypothetical protein
MGLALSNCTNIIFVDYQEEIITYNKINTALILMAKDRQAFINLRETNNFNDWLKDLKKIKREEIQTSITIENFNNFQELKDNSRKIDINKISLGNFDYKANDNIFNILKTKLKNAEFKIIFLKANLANTNDLNQFKKIIKTNKLEIAAVDISNAWEDKKYELGKPKNMKKLSQTLTEINPESLIITSEINPEYYKKAKKELKGFQNEWIFKQEKIKNTYCQKTLKEIQLFFTLQ